MSSLKGSSLPLKSVADVLIARQLVRQWCIDLKFSSVDQTKMVTAASELARNTIEHGGGGTLTLELVENGSKKGLRLVFEDQGPGIADVELAMKGGYTTTARGMGVGLGGSKRLTNEFEIDTKPGQGTRITVIRWK